MEFETDKPRGFFAIGVFLFFGATITALAAVTLLWSGTVLDRVWRLNPRAHSQLLPHRHLFGPMFVVLSAALMVAGIGWFRRQRWGWRLTVATIATQVLGDVLNGIQGDFVRGGIGIILAATLLLYLLRPAVRNAFANLIL